MSRPGTTLDLTPLSPAHGGDPTMLSLAAFNDPSRWEIVRNAPVFVEHDRYNPETGELAHKFDLKRLQRVIDETNQLRETAGVVPKIITGHTKSKNPKTGEEPKETDQPDIVGFAPRGLRLGTFGPMQKPAIVTDLYYRREDYGEAKKYPFRSVEIYPGRDTITAIALLKRDPALDMGMLIPYARAGGEEIYYYAMENTAMALDDTMPGAGSPDLPAVPGGDSDDDKVLKAMSKHPAFKYMCDKYMAETGDKDMGGMAKYMDAGAAAGGPSALPSPTNGALPAATPAADDALRMQRDQQAIHYARLERELAEERKARQDFQLQYQKVERERDLIQLEAEGYQFDRKELLDQVAALPADQYARQIATVRKHYQRAPVGGHLLRTGTPPAGQLPAAPPAGGRQFPESRMGEVIQYMETHKVDVVKAMEAVMKVTPAA